MASGVALDILHLVMPHVSLQCLRMAIKMACDVGAFVGGPLIKYLSSGPFFFFFGLTAVLKILSFGALALGDNIANL